MDKWIRENKIIATIIVIVALVFGNIYFNKQSINSNTDSQVKCAAQAKLFFDYFVSDLQERQSDAYSNHYNNNLNKCFVLIKVGTTSVNKTYTKILYDAIEKNIYGSFSFDIVGGSAGLFDCTMYPNGNQDSVKICRSEDEFNAFTNPYMRN